MSLQPDILVLQECSAKDIANTDAPFKHWVGSNQQKGMAIIGFANYEYTLDSSYTQEWPWFLPHREHSHSQLVAKLAGLGLVSTYHVLRNELQGQEATPTQYMYRHLTKPYHLDYAFVSQALSRSCELLIGEPNEWLHKSDHMPLLLTISV